MAGSRVDLANEHVPVDVGGIGYGTLLAMFDDDGAICVEGELLGDHADQLSIGIETGPPIGSQKGPLPLVASGQRA